MNTEPSRPALDIAELRASAVEPAGRWRLIDVVTQTGSTNADLLARASAGEDIRGAVLAAEFQNAGRGRHGRVWSAPARSQISVSVGIDAAAVPPSGWGWLPLATGVAVVDAVAEVTGVQAGLKWPNDVLVPGGKLGGILAEVAAPAQVIVVGLGLNVTLTEAEAPDPAARSLAMLGVPDVDRNQLLSTILGHLASRIDSWRAANGADKALAADYRRRSVTLGSDVRAILPGDKQVIGVARDVDQLGRLLIDTADERVTVAAGDVTHLRPAG
ncbi:biotin--[acetyl-CoA-carboxylase] ligase [Mycolicibacterium komossense]|uniref:biotin--[biotin carboxyl-carrier protein] ligase n=1 Tax=Mycolicibacterium komossense TaxID=1779 RepID=A0ABT3CD39_9MYCO|nr:biotin--[acetyl-CoA-carboxylase] ligase [Mycolicibacterium komossense]MCV7227161.1 biotin--[acetyl-CoA-carboxylase] ligase [Mycolicibacterium komossense]